MVAVRRINPENGVGRLFKELKGDVKSQQTRASGNIVIRETLTATDPSTGVSVIIGQLPDGSTGLQEFVNDVTPPGQPTAPTASPVIGAVSLAWDGFEVGGNSQPKDYDRTEIMYRAVTAIGAWSLGGVFYGASSALVSNLTSGVEYEFRLISYDKNGNPSTPSTTVRAMAGGVLDNSDIADAIAEVREDAAQAVQDSATAQTAAAAAQKAAEKAAADAASGAGASRTIFSPTAPTDAKDRVATNLWIDISGSPAKNTPNRWDGTGWVAVTDSVAVKAAADAAAAKSAADAASTSAETAARVAGEAQTAANGKNKVWYTNAAPAGTTHKSGDIWFDTGNGNRPNVWDGAKWALAQDTAIAAAKSVADLAVSMGQSLVVNGNFDAGSTGWNVIAGSEITPTAKRGGTNGLRLTPTNGNMWVTNQWVPAATGRTYYMEMWIRRTGTDLTTGTTRVAGFVPQVRDVAGTMSTPIAGGLLDDGSAATAASIPTDTFVRVSSRYTIAQENISSVRFSPWVYKSGNVYDVDDMLVLDVTESDKALTDAKADTTTRLAGKTKTWVQSAQPSNTGNVTGDTWIDTDDGNKLYVWNGSAWASAQDSTIITALNAANGKNKIVFSESDASGTTGYTAGDLWMKRDTSGAIIAQWEFTTSWQKRTLSESVLGNLSAGKITSGTIGADRLDAKDIRTKIIAADRISAVDILASGSITATNGIIGSIDAAKITVGELDGVILKGKSITTDKLLITSSDNVIQEPDFSAGGVSWGRTTTVTYVAGAGRGSGNVLRFTGATLNQSSVNNQPKIAVEPGAAYAGTVWVKSNAALPVGNVKLVMRCFTTATAYTDVEIASNTAALVVNTWTQLSGRTTAGYGVVPANTVNAQFLVQVVNLATANVTDVDYVSAVRKADGKLIVDGSIDGKIITGALIQSVAASNRGIKLNDSQFIAYDNSGTETLRLDGANAIMTGATIRTAATGARVQIDATGLTAFDINNVAYMTVTNGRLTMQGNLEASGVTRLPNSGTSGTRVIASVGTDEFLGGSVISPGFAFKLPDQATNTSLGPAGLFTTNGSDVRLTSRAIGSAGMGRTNAHLDIGDDRTITTESSQVWFRDGVINEAALIAGSLKIPTEFATAAGAAGTVPTQTRLQTFAGIGYVDVTSLRQTGIAANTVWGPGQPGWSAQMNNNFVDWARNDYLKFLRNGIYSITYSVRYDSAVTGRSFVGLEQVGLSTPLARNAYYNGEDTATTTIIRNFAAGAEVRMVHFSNVPNNAWLHMSITRLTDYETAAFVR